MVDDEPQLVDLFSRMVQSADECYRPIRAFGGEEALARLRSQCVDLVLLDLLMTEVDGLAVLRAMKEDATLSQIPVIVISAQYPETTQTDRGLDIHLVRAQSGSMTDTLNLLQTLVMALPPRPPTVAETETVSRPA